MSLRTRWRRFRDQRHVRRTFPHRALSAFSEAYAEPFFIEIGAGDGATYDHLRPFVLERGWRGVMVEPVPYVFEWLRRNYEGTETVALENVAVADHDGRVPFFYFAEPNEQERERVPGHYHLLGSLSREMLLGHTDVPERERRIVEAEVPSMTFASLCAKHDVETLDLLLIDAEGHDCEILAGIDVEALRPRLIVYEDAHVPDPDASRAIERLEHLGYVHHPDGLDRWCLDAWPDDALTASWRRLVEAASA